jgi:LacI family transcriptional regulator
MPDNRRAGQLATEHLLENGYRRIVFVPHGDLEYSRLRGEGARQAVVAAGLPFTEIRTATPYEPHSWVTALAHLPRPLGIVAGDDVAANYVLEATPFLQASVPEEIAVVGITNAELACHNALVPLSSVDLNPTEVGIQAAQLLMRLIAGKKPPRKPILVPPHGVVVRASSDAFASTDPLINDILRHARQHLAAGLLVKDLAQHFGMSVRHLSRLFRERTGRSPAEMQQRLAVGQAKHLLRNSPLTIPQIAAQCGYNQVSHFGALFRKLTGTTPATFRDQPH